MEATESNGFSEISSDTVEQESNNDANEEKQEECQGEQKHENPITEPLSPVNVNIDDGETGSESAKRQIDSPFSTTASDTSSTRPNKRKRKGTAPTRHVQQAEGNEIKTNDLDDEEGHSETEFDKAYNEIDKANNRKLLEEFETKSEILSRPESINENLSSQSRPQKYGPPRLDLFGPPQHYLDLFGPPVRENTDNCSVVIRGIGEEEIYCGPGDKDPGDMMIPLRTSSNY